MISLTVSPFPVPGYPPALQITTTLYFQFLSHSKVTDLTNSRQRVKPLPVSLPTQQLTFSGSPPHFLFLVLLLSALSIRQLTPRPLAFYCLFFKRISMVNSTLTSADEDAGVRLCNKIKPADVRN